VFRIQLGVCGAAAAIAFASGAAVAAPAVHVTLAGAIVARDASGAERLTPLAEREPAPGQRIRYTVMTENAGPDPARTVVSSARIPAGTRFEPGTAAASGPASVEFSLDGGKTWSARPLVKRHTPAGDVTVAADPSAYTTIRWAAAKLGAHERERFTYEVTVR
jgi:uncharacterized repeat protein (TIGR01451 family)